MELSRKKIRLIKEKILNTDSVLELSSSLQEENETIKKSSVKYFHYMETYIKKYLAETKITEALKSEMEEKSVALAETQRLLEDERLKNEQSMQLIEVYKRQMSALMKRDAERDEEIILLLKGFFSFLSTKKKRFPPSLKTQLGKYLNDNRLKRYANCTFMSNPKKSTGAFDSASDSGFSFDSPSIYSVSSEHCDDDVESVGDTLIDGSVCSLDLNTLLGREEGKSSQILMEKPRELTSKVANSSEFSKSLPCAREIEEKHIENDQLEPLSESTLEINAEEQVTLKNEENGAQVNEKVQNAKNILLESSREPLIMENNVIIPSKQARSVFEIGESIAGEKVSDIVTTVDSEAIELNFEYQDIDVDIMAIMVEMLSLRKVLSPLPSSLTKKQRNASPVPKRTEVVRELTFDSTDSLNAPEGESQDHVNDLLNSEDNADYDLKSTLNETISEDGEKSDELDDLRTNEEKLKIDSSESNPIVVVSKSDFPQSLEGTDEDISPHLITSLSPFKEIQSNMGSLVAPDLLTCNRDDLAELDVTSCSTPLDVCVSDVQENDEADLLEETAENLPAVEEKENVMSSKDTFDTDMVSPNPKDSDKSSEDCVNEKTISSALNSPEIVSHSESFNDESDSKTNQVISCKEIEEKGQEAVHVQLRRKNPIRKCTKQKSEYEKCNKIFLDVSSALISKKSMEEVVLSFLSPSDINKRYEELKEELKDELKEELKDNLSPQRYSLRIRKSCHSPLSNKKKNSTNVVTTIQKSVEKSNSPQNILEKNTILKRKCADLFGDGLSDEENNNSNILSTETLNEKNETGIVEPLTPKRITHKLKNQRGSRKFEDKSEQAKRPKLENLLSGVESSCKVSNTSFRITKSSQDSENISQLSKPSPSVVELSVTPCNNTTSVLHEKEDPLVNIPANHKSSDFLNLSSLSECKQSCNPLLSASSELVPLNVEESPSLSQRTVGDNRSDTGERLTRLSVSSDEKPPPTVTFTIFPEAPLYSSCTVDELITDEYPTISLSESTSFLADIDDNQSPLSPSDPEKHVEDDGALPQIIPVDAIASSTEHEKISQNTEKGKVVNWNTNWKKELTVTKGSEKSPSKNVSAWWQSYKNFANIKRTKTLAEEKCLNKKGPSNQMGDTNAQNGRKNAEESKLRNGVSDIGPKNIECLGNQNEKIVHVNAEISGRDHSSVADVTTSHQSSRDLLVKSNVKNNLCHDAGTFNAGTNVKSSEPTHVIRHKSTRDLLLKDNVKEHIEATANNASPTAYFPERLGPPRVYSDLDNPVDNKQQVPTVNFFPIKVSLPFNCNNLMPKQLRRPQPNHLELNKGKKEKRKRKREKKNKEKMEKKDTTIMEERGVPVLALKGDLKIARNVLDAFVSSQYASSEEANSKVKECFSVLSNMSDEIVIRAITGIILENVDEDLDLRFTPPAPPLTPTQHRLITLLSLDQRFSKELCRPLARSIHTYIYPETFFWPDDCLINCARFYTALCKHMGDPKMAAQLCLTAVAEMHQRGPIVIYTVLRTWPEVLTRAENTAFGSPECTFAFLVLQTPNPERSEQQKTLMNLKSLLKMYYGFKIDDPINVYLTKLVEQFLTCGNATLLAESFELLTRKFEWLWASKMIVRPIVDAIDAHWISGQLQDERASAALDAIARIFVRFPLKVPDAMQFIQEVVTRLQNILLSGKVSHRGEEFIVETFAKLSKFLRFDMVIKDWIPREIVRGDLQAVINRCVRSGSCQRWKSFKGKPKKKTRKKQ